MRLRTNAIFCLHPWNYCISFLTWSGFILKPSYLTGKWFYVVAWCHCFQFFWTPYTRCLLCLEKPNEHFLLRNKEVSIDGPFQVDHESSKKTGGNSTCGKHCWEYSPLRMFFALWKPPPLQEHTPYVVPKDKGLTRNVYKLPFFYDWIYDHFKNDQGISLFLEYYIFTRRSTVKGNNHDVLKMRFGWKQRNSLQENSFLKSKK